nr:uncharacterized protein LOC100177334 isoform X1 [Ciona intestinalis]XP_018671581.1 uncharacterized protein LOC100177334 isoform X1 [Ciona intestinalis]XP_026694728.1 uncharacterized protein LOC100177334 isoform X1 [Ciona intestinalis]|eukprot:XP_018671579.1 uncharacterized protein LOC100177334 isoform X1 [Ciona intestinalis]
MSIRSLCFVVVVALSLQPNKSEAFSAWTKWSSWSACSKTCGAGIRLRERICARTNMTGRCAGSKLQHGRCYEKICSSYLDWPRIHFTGKVFVDTPTTNNYRCYFDNQHFCPHCNTFRNAYASKIIKSNVTLPRYKFSSNTPNPMGTGHFFFHETTVKSVCWEKGKPCTTVDPMVKRKVHGVSPGRMVDLDVDWQLSPEVVGYDIHIPGVLTAHMVAGISNQLTIRIFETGTSGGDMKDLASIKSKLVRVKWIDPYFKAKFRNKTSLSIIFTIDLFTYVKYMGRISGTIGMTSDDDPVNVFGSRVMKPNNAVDVYEAPINLDVKSKILLLDLASAIKCNAKGNFAVNDLKNVDVIVYPVTDSICRSPVFDCCIRSLSCGKARGFLLTIGGALNYVQKSQDWYTTYGGIVEISLAWADEHILDILANSRFGLVSRSKISASEILKSPPLSYTMFSLLPQQSCNMETKIGSCKLVMSESPFGINYKPMGRFTERKSRGETWDIQTLVSSFGRPLQGANLFVRNIKKSKTLASCTSRKDPCGMYLSVPANALDLGNTVTSDVNGVARLPIKVVRSPGFPRRCGIDGQVYILGMFLDYTSHGQRVKLGDGGMFVATMSSQTERLMIKQCGIDRAFGAMGLALKVYGSLPVSTMQKTCPTWVDDVKPIFQFYNNMVPVMARDHIIDLRNVQDVRSKLRMINMSMFEYDWNHPNFMPTTRDLSPDKTEIVRRWLECEMNGITGGIPTQKTSFTAEQQNVCGSARNLEKTVDDLRRYIQGGMWIELYTIPPYMTAMFSLKKNHPKEAYSLLKSIVTEEMLHMSLNSNVLNAIGGKPNLTDDYWLPDYPTNFPSLDFYQIKPDLTLKLEKFSTSLLKDFSEIEEPSPPSVQRILHNIALLWGKLPEDGGGRWNSREQDGKTVYEDSASGVENTPRWLEDAYTYHDNGRINLLRSSQDNFWSEVFEISSQLLEQPDIMDAYSIGGFYAHVMLKIIQTESCVRLENESKTIFTGLKTRQLGPNQWYGTKGLSSATLFPVHSLKSGIEALMEIVYEGEGGTLCSPYMTSLPDSNASQQHVGAQAYTSNVRSYEEKSHYVKFQEMINGRKLKLVKVKRPEWSEADCLVKHDFCSCQSSNSSKCQEFCYKGESIAITSRDVWPVYHVYYIGGSNSGITRADVVLKAQLLLSHFDRIYTKLLQCLESSMNGEPSKMSTCIGNMYELVTAGKKLARTHILKPDSPENRLTATPRWQFVKDNYQLNGLDDMSGPSNVDYC